MKPGIIIVEDNIALQQILTVFLRHKVPTIPVYTCASSAEALEICTYMPVSCAVVDYALPDQDGVTLAEHMIARWPQMAVFLLTGHPEASIHRDAYRVGCVDVLIKPASLRSFWEAIQPFLKDEEQLLSHRALGAATIDSIVVPRQFGGETGPVAQYG